MVRIDNSEVVELTELKHSRPVAPQDHFLIDGFMINILFRISRFFFQTQKTGETVPESIFRAANESPDFFQNARSI